MVWQVVWSLCQLQNHGHPYPSFHDPFHLLTGSCKNKEHMTIMDQPFFLGPSCTIHLHPRTLVASAVARPVARPVPRLAAGDQARVVGRLRRGGGDGRHGGLVAVQGLLLGANGVRAPRSRPERGKRERVVHPKGSKKWVLFRWFQKMVSLRRNTYAMY